MAIDLDKLIADAKRPKPRAVRSPRRTPKPRSSRKAGPAVHLEAQLQFLKGTSAKFWNVLVQGRTVKKRWGRIGTAGQRQEKVYDSVADAVNDAEKQVAAKLKKGYVRV